MNVQTIEMDPRIARIHYADYRKKVRENRERRKEELDKVAKEAGKEMRRIQIAKSKMDLEDEELLIAYRALSRGQRILNIYTVLSNAGLEPSTRLPVLAIARAGTETVFLRAERWGAVTFHREQWAHGRKPDVSIPRDRYPAELWNDEWRRQNNKVALPVRTSVPSVPAHLRPANLGDYYILWEVEEWRSTVAPDDPILLKRLTDSTYVVVAAWDLTPVEQAVLEGRT